MAQRTASTTLANSASTLSPAVLAIRPRKASDQLVGDRPMRRQRGESRLLVERHQPAVAFDIGCEDGDQPAIEGRCFHVRSYSQLFI